MGARLACNIPCQNVLIHFQCIEFEREIGFPNNKKNIPFCMYVFLLSCNLTYSLLPLLLYVELGDVPRDVT